MKIPADQWGRLLIVEALTLPNGVEVYFTNEAYPLVTFYTREGYGRMVRHPHEYVASLETTDRFGTDYLDVEEEVATIVVTRGAGLEGAYVALRLAERAASPVRLVHWDGRAEARA